jgi:hypothetical protein
MLSLETEKEPNATTLQTYLYLVRVGKPVGPRDLMRGANLSSPSVAYRNLQKLVEQGLVEKDTYGNYIVKKKIRIKGYLWFGKTLVPTFAIFGFIFIAVLAAELAVLTIHLILGGSIEESFWLLTIVTVVAAAIFLIEALRFRKKPNF